MPLPDLRQVADTFQQRIPDLQKELQRLVLSIPPGRVVCYGDLAKSLGDSVASRWVATYLLLPDGPLAEYSHRVVRSTGELGLYCSGDVAEKVQRLTHEGVVVAGSRVDLERYRWELPAVAKPLLELKAWQRDFVLPSANDVDLNEVRTIGGLDVSYRGETAVAVCSCFGADGQRVLRHEVKTLPVQFPYITGYLAFRELPVYLELLAEMQAAERLPDVLLVDGNGKLHPRRMGIATMLGALVGIPTIGIAKSRLCGTLLNEDLKVGTWGPIVASVDEPHEVLGYALLPHSKTKNPLFISEGYAVGEEAMRSLVDRCFAGHRSPEPIYHADRESRRVASTL